MTAADGESKRCLPRRDLGSGAASMLKASFWIAQTAGDGSVERRYQVVFGRGFYICLLSMEGRGGFEWSGIITGNMPGQNVRVRTIIIVVMRW